MVQMSWYEKISEEKEIFLPFFQQEGAMFPAQGAEDTQ